MTATLNIDRRQLISLVMQLPKSEQRDLARKIMSSWEDSAELSQPPMMSSEEVELRICESENDIANGRFMVCEDVHRNIEEKFQWLRE